MAELNHLTDLSNLNLSSNQRRLWIISQQAKLNPAYNIQIVYHFEERINIEILRQSTQIIFDRQHTMFSVFKHVEGIPHIEICFRQVDVQSKDFSGVLPQSRMTEILSFAREDSRIPFDLEKGPLYRLFLLKEDDKSYYFYATFHHLVFDGFTRRLFMQELGKVYSSILSGTYVKNEPLRYHSYDFALYEKSLLSAEKEKELIEFWKANMQDCPPETKFPYDYPRKRESTGFGSKESFSIAEEYTGKLRKLSLGADSSLFNTLLSVIGLLFQKYTGENDICIGVPVSNRRSSDSFKAFGMLINTMAVRLKIEEENSFINHINYTAGVIKKSLAYSDLPFEKIVEALNPPRMTGINPFFQILFSWINNLNGPVNLGGVTGRRISFNEGVSSSDITFYMWEEHGHLEGEIEYNTDILTRDTVIRLKDNFISLIKELAENPEQFLSDISLFSDDDRRMLSEFNNTARPVPSCLVQQLFEQQVLITPSKTAVISGESSISYADLDLRSNQLAQHLKTLGVSGGDVVGICVKRSIEMVVSVLAVHKAGCCYLPMDPAFPDDRIKFMYEDSGAKVLITQSNLKDKFQNFSNTRIVLTDHDKDTISKCSAVKPQLEITPDFLAYIIYTSGSTGKPKGVKVHHQAVVNFVNSMARKPGFSKDNRLLAVTTLSFDISVLELFVPISFGAQLIIADAGDISDGKRLSDLLVRHDIDAMQATPATWNILLASGWKGKKDLKALCGGEPILPSLINDLLPKVKALWNMYGPTETTVWSTCRQLTDSSLPVLVGSPIDNTSVFILDKKNRQLPVRITGEVCIGGMGVSSGYHNRPELTAEKFILFENGERIYKTGDLGRFLANGNIELFGRIDNQIKLRGFRIEPGEIESRLSGLPGVKEAVVKVHKFGENDERLVAFLNTDHEFKLTKGEITAAMSQYLPAYMIPSFIQMSEEFPRLPNGKTDKKAIILKTEDLESKQDQNFDSFTLTEKKLVEIWQNVLKIKKINITDNFFNIGGNSLLAINISSKIMTEFQIDLDLRVFFDSPCIKDLANSIDNSLKLQTGKNFIKSEVNDADLISGEI